MVRREVLSPEVCGCEVGVGGGRNISCVSCTHWTFRAERSLKKCHISCHHFRDKDTETFVYLSDLLKVTHFSFQLMEINVTFGKAQYSTVPRDQTSTPNFLFPFPVPS